MDEQAELFVHAQILVKFDQRRAIDLIVNMILSSQSGHGPPGSADFSKVLKEEVIKLCNHRVKNYNQVMYAARQGEFRDLLPRDSSHILRDNNTSHEPSRSPLLMQQHPARLPAAPSPPFVSPTPPASVYSGNSENRSSVEHIRVLDRTSGTKEHQFSVKYSGLGLNFIRAKALEQLDGWSLEQCEQVREVSLDATGRDHLFITNCCTRLAWYRPQWREADDMRTEEDIFYIVENLNSVVVLMGESRPRQPLALPERGMYEGLRQYESHRGDHSFVNPTASYLLPVGGTPQYYEPRLEHVTQPDPPRDFSSRLHQPQPQAGFPPQQPAYNVETRFQSTDPVIRDFASVQESQQQQHASNNPPTQGNHGQTEQSPTVVWVNWSFDGQEADEELDLSTSDQNFKDTLKRVLRDYLTMEADLDLYKLKFSILPSRKSTTVIFKDKNIKLVWGNIVKWMQKNDPGNEHYQCQIVMLSGPT
ncbi:hypothetical protein N431DRAFT_445368 [Stipitochalara longipes BDJ]|nr:hypothetical protein N431DRAFT_445368 [Stipitochalara longipes BDJ]